MGMASRKVIQQIGVDTPGITRKIQVSEKHVYIEKTQWKTEKHS